MTPENITIAVTVYNRRQYVKQAIASALDQTAPVRVLVVEDCGPDSTLEGFVKAEFGSRIEYVRNPRRRGLFGNWNACLEWCRTEWISILHDDDFLAPNFVETILKLAGAAPGLDLYFGQTVLVNEQGEPVPGSPFPAVAGPWKKIALTDVLYGSPLSFPGQLFRVASALGAGGFRASSCYCGEWEMWAKLIARGGAAQTREFLGFFREHGAWDRGTNQVLRSGKAIPAAIVQHKRVLALLPPEGRIRFNRRDYQRRRPIPVMCLLRFGQTMSPRLLRYHAGLLRLSRAPHWRYVVFQQLTRLGGARFVKLMSWIWNRCRGDSEKRLSSRGGSES